MASAFLEQLRRKHGPDSSPGTRGLYYVFTIAAGEIQLALRLGGVQPSDRPALEQAYRLQPSHLRHPPPFLKPVDIELLAALAEHAPGWRQGERGVLPAGIDHAWLSRLVETARACTESGQRIAPAPAITATCGWTIDGAGVQRLCWQVPATVTLLPTRPLGHFDRAGPSIGPVTTGLPPAAEAWVREAPAVAPDEVADFLQHRGDRLADWGLPRPVQLSTTSAHPEPVGRLTLTSAPPGGSGPRDTMHLGFHYAAGAAPADFAAGEPATARTVHDAGRSCLVRIERDPDRETALTRNLAAHLEAHAAEWSAEGSITLPDDRRWQAFMVDTRPGLEQRGWRIRIEPGFRHRVVRPDDIRLNAAWQERDWLEFALEIDVGGEALALLPLLHEAAQRYSLAALQAMAPDTEVPLALADGRSVLLAAGRLAHWLRTLAELTERTQASLRLPASQLTRLAQLDDGRVDIAADARPLLDRAHALHTPTTTLPDCPLPADFRGEPRGYQRLGIAWLQQRQQLGVGGILADDMGLGKTLQVLAHIALERAAGRLDRPALVVAPTSLLGNWQAEARRFCPQLRVLVLHGPGRHRRWPELAEHDILLTSYTLIANDHEQWRRQPLHCAILDEAQAIRNPQARISRAVRELEADCRFCLSGTPLQNHLGELRALLDFVLPGCLDSEARFNQRYRRPIEHEGDNDRASALMERIAPFVLRRTKRDVARDLPPKTEIALRLPLTDAQRDLYELLREHSAAQLHAAANAGDDPQARVHILQALMQLRQVCCDPGLIDGAALATATADAVDRAPSAKRDHLRGMLRELVGEGRAVLVFSQFTRMLERIAADLDDAGIDHALLTGQTRERERAVQRFQEGAADVFLISLKAGGSGLNLTRADTVIHYDPWWNSAAEEQATDRAHRIGQQQPVFVYRLLASATVEEKIHALQAHKRELLHRVYSASESRAERLALDNATLLHLLEPA